MFLGGILQKFQVREKLVDVGVSCWHFPAAWLAHFRVPLEIRLPVLPSSPAYI